MKITRSNYESWFLDYLEGNLDSSLMDEFQVFLRENPDLAAELEMGALITLESNQEIHFDAKENLRKSVSDQQVEFEERAVAYYEGDLSLSERINFEASLSENSARAAEAEEFGRLKLIADKKVVYKNKEQLRRKVTIFPLWIKLASVAAMLLLAYLLIKPGNSVRPVNVQLADNIKNKESKGVVVPEKKVKMEDKSTGRVQPVVNPRPTPIAVPAKQKMNPAGQKSEKNLVPAPNLRAPEVEPSLLKPRSIYFGQNEEVELAVMTLRDTMEASREYQLSELLEEQLAAIRNSDDREFLSTDHLGLSGLQLFAKLSGKRLTARKGENGTVRSVSYNSRLLAFSIPINR
jgi:hypothetical protein